MTFYIVRAKPKNDFSGLRKELELGKVSKLRPFGETLHQGLQNARFDTNNSYAMWVEEDFCSPPLAMERESVMDRYFDDITVELVKSEEDRWNKFGISRLLSGWNIIRARFVQNFFLESASTIKSCAP